METKSHHSKMATPAANQDDAKSIAPSWTASQVGRLEEAKRHEEYLQSIRTRYVSIIDKDAKPYSSTMVGLNPNMRPTAEESLKKIFPM